MLREVFPMLSVLRPYNEEQLQLREILETAVRRVGVSCERVDSQKGRKHRSWGSYGVSIIFKITPLHGPHGIWRLLFFKNACLQLRYLATDVLLFRVFAWRRPHRKHSFSYIVVKFLRGVLTGRRIETAVLLFLPIFVAVWMFTYITLLL
jgi:hypothetical protein